ncbi:nuclear transport factor 2 family protein [Jatrophihabitans sp. YIM 134969]
MSTIATTYLDAWNETDAAARRARLDDVFAADVTYVDPTAEVHGRDELDATIGAVQRMFPGFVFTPLGATDAHHRQARFRWGLGPVDSAPVVEGADVVLTDDDGRITTVLGFLDVVPG